MPIPAGRVPNLERDGVVLLRLSRPFPVANFRHYRFIGILPEDLQQRLRAGLDQRSRRVAKESGEQ